MLRLSIAFILSLVLVLPAMAKKTDCISVNGQLYCKDVSEVKVGGVSVKVTNPAELLRKAKQDVNKLKRTGLYDEYSRLPVVVELASQNGMEYDEFVTYMIDHWSSDELNPFQTLREFENIYEEVHPIYRHTLVTGIAYRVASDVQQAIYVAFGIMT